MSVDPRAFFGGKPRVLFVHAHPDDETISTGGVLAALSQAGMEPLVVTLTRGEQGEVTPGPFAHLAGTDALAPHRQQELAAALAMLGVERHAFLGVPPARAEGLDPVIYEDSGMEWGAHGKAQASQHASADALTVVPAVEALNDLFAAANNSGAGAIVSYNEGGGYGHPDHVFAHRLSRAVAHALMIPFYEIVPGNESPVAENDENVSVESYDISEWFDRKVMALRMHGTQLSVDGEEIVHVGGQRETITKVERFQLRGMAEEVAGD